MKEYDEIVMRVLVQLRKLYPRLEWMGLLYADIRPGEDDDAYNYVYLQGSVSVNGRVLVARFGYSIETATEDVHALCIEVGSRMGHEIVSTVFSSEPWKAKQSNGVVH